MRDYFFISKYLHLKMAHGGERSMKFGRTIGTKPTQLVEKTSTTESVTTRATSPGLVRCDWRDLQRGSNDPSKPAAPHSGRVEITPTM